MVSMFEGQGVVNARVGIQSVALGSIPNCLMALSPNVAAIQVRDRMKDFSLMPSNFWRVGTIWMALEPLPMTPTCLFLKSYLHHARSTTASKS